MQSDPSFDRRCHDALQRARAEAFAKQIPILYVILSVNVATLMATHWDRTPTFLGLVVPGLLVGAAVGRMIVWLLRARGVVAWPRAEAHFEVTHWIAIVFCVVYLAWIGALYHFGDVETRSQVAATFGITAICCIYCLLHFPSLALTLAATALPAVSLFLVMRGSTTEIAFAANLVVVGLGLAYMVVRSGSDFEHMIRHQTAVADLGRANEKMAHTDGLTGLSNRLDFFRRLEADLAGRPHDRLLHVGVLDLDGFKPVNDVMGHAIGDRVLVECAERLSAVLPGVVHPARIGGDEFAVLISDVSAEEALVLGRRICEALAAPYAFDDVVANVSASLGLATWPDHGVGATQLYERADFTLYHCKQNDRGTVQMFHPEHEAIMREDARIERALQRADLAGELSVVFQPVVSLSADAPVAWEALARWTGVELGAIPPARFIASAERSDLIFRLTRLLLRKTLDLVDALPAGGRVSFNLSPREVTTPGAVAQLLAIVEASGVAPARIDFEVTETALLRDFDRAVESLSMIRAFGCGVVLDDFGAGHSDLGRLHRLPLDKVKIDRAFVRETDADPRALQILGAMIEICDRLGLTCIIEGVETEAQLDRLRHLGCDLFQGYLFGAPAQLVAPAPPIADVA